VGYFIGLCGLHLI